MVRTREELMETLRTRIGEGTDDETLAVIEDFSDTLNDFEARVNSNEAEEWKRKFEENDASWRQRYRDRFYSNEEKEEKIAETFEEKEERDEPTTFEELFKEG